MKIFFSVCVYYLASNSASCCCQANPVKNMGSNMMKPDSPEPEPPYEPKFDPLLGFPNGRKVRTVKTTKEEMESAAVPPENRDYCVDEYMQFMACRRVHFPLVYKCKHDLHKYHDCEYEDFNLRMKEYERESRLKKLVERKQGA